MKCSPRKSLALLVALVLLVTCLLSGLVLPVAAATPSKLTLTTDTLYVLTGRTRPMGSLTVTYDNSTTATIDAASATWSINNTAVATVNSAGAISALTVGDATVTASYSGVTATCSLHVVDGSKYVYADIPYTLGAEYLTNGDFEQGNTNWGSSATVANGVGTDGSKALSLSEVSGCYYTKALGLKADTTYELSFDYLPAPNSSFYVNLVTRITKTFTDSVPSGWQHASAVFTTPKDMHLNPGWDLLVHCAQANADQALLIDNISVKEYISTQTITGLSLSETAVTIQSGAKHTLTAYTEPYGGNLNGTVWTTSNPAVVTVQSGIVTGIGAGTATVTATTASGHTASCTVQVKGNAALLTNTTFDDVTSNSWKSCGGTKLQFIENAGLHGSTVLRIDRNYPVAQEVTGLKPNATYTLKAMVSNPNYQNLPSATGHGYFCVTLTCGDEVLFENAYPYYNLWGKQGGISLPLTQGVTFTTPSTLKSDKAVLSLAVLTSADDDTAIKTGTIGAAPSTSTAAVEPGEGEVTDNDDDLTLEGKYYMYVDEATLFETLDADIDLAATKLTWTGDDGKGQVNPGTAITFSVTVKNEGTEAVPAGQPFTVDIAANTEVIRTLTYSGGIAAGGSVTITDTGAWTATAGDYMISARVNADWDLLESNSLSNQTCQLNLRVATDRVSPTYDNVANAVAQAGMDRLTMSDDFDSLATVDTKASGAEGYKWYVTRPWGGTTLTPNDYRIDNGVLTMMNEDPTYNIGFSSVDRYTGNGYTYQNGYLEARIRIVRPSANASGEEGVPAIWSFTQDKALEQVNGSCSHWVELDWLEYWGITRQYPQGYYTMTMHDSTTEEGRAAYTNGNPHLKGLGNTEWHVMGWLWEQGSIRTFLDGVEVHNTLFSAEAPAVPAQNPKKDSDGNPLGTSTDIGAFAHADEEACVLYLGGSKDNPLEIDYIRIWQTSEPSTVSNNMTISKETVTISERDHTRLSVTVPAGEDCGTLTWNTSDATVATVHANGDVYARNAGTAVITATNANGISVLCKVTVTHNLITGADFEWENDLLFRNWSNEILANESCTIVADPDNSANKCLSIGTGLTGQSVYYAALPVQPGKTYRLTGKYKDTTSTGTNPYFYFNGNYVTSVTDLNKTSNGTGTSWREFELGSADSNKWKPFALEFTTTNGTINNYYILCFGHKEKKIIFTIDYTAYFDDLMLVEVEDVPQDKYSVTVPSVANGSLTLTANGSTVSGGATLTPGTTVTVTAEPASGYRLQLGSLQYSYQKATFDGDKAGANPTVTRRVLNKNGTTFGEGNGNSFTFTMPAGNVTLAAVFESKTATGADQLPVATLGTSVYTTADGKYSGIRFLNRLYVENIDVTQNDIYLTYQGSTQKVAEFGSLLKRATNTAVGLTLEDYEAHKNDSSATRIWKTASYRGADAYLVDYTDQYMDFTTIMTSAVANRSSFLLRSYTTCAYLVLEDGTTLYTDAFTDSVLDAVARQ